LWRWCITVTIIIIIIIGDICCKGTGILRYQSYTPHDDSIRSLVSGIRHSMYAVVGMPMITTIRMRPRNYCNVKDLQSTVVLSRPSHLARSSSNPRIPHYYYLHWLTKDPAMPTIPFLDQQDLQAFVAPPDEYIPELQANLTIQAIAAAYAPPHNVWRIQLSNLPPQPPMMTPSLDLLSLGLM